MKRWLIAAAAALLLLLGAGAAYVAYKRDKAADVRGSSTVEFVTTEEEEPLPPPPAAETLEIAWPLNGYDAERQRVGPYQLKPPFRRIWMFRARNLLEFPPAVAYGRLYFTNNSGVMFAVNAKTGKRAWKKPIGRCVAASPAVADHTVFQVFLNRPPCNSKAKPGRLEGEVIAFASGFGKIRWRTRIGPSETSPLVVDGVVYVGDWRGRVYALDARTGRVRWTFQGKGRIKGGIARSGNRLYVGTYSGYVYALRAGTGKVIWRTRSQDRLGGRGQFYSTPATTGDLRWRFDAGDHISGSATVLDGVVYFSTFDERTFALAARTGRRLWTFPDGKYAGVVADRDRIYLAGHARLYGLVER
jgi:outer membrane protein assembly factor BamB